MKSSETIIEFIDQRTAALLDAPASFSPNPSALEEVLIILDTVRQFATTDAIDPERPLNSRYNDFLQARGYGVSTVTATAMAVGFDDVVREWREYLNYK